MSNRSKVKEQVLEESKRGVEIEGMEAWSNRYLEDKVDPSTGFARERANKRASKRAMLPCLEAKTRPIANCGCEQRYRVTFSNDRLLVSMRYCFAT